MTSLQTDQTQIKLEFIEKQEEKLALRHFPTEDQKLQCSKNQSSGPRACWTECQKLCEFFEKSNRRTDEGKVASSELFRGHEKFITQRESKTFVWHLDFSNGQILLLQNVSSFCLALTAVVWVVRV